MTIERQPRPDEVFNDAMDLPPERRSEFLDHACGDDPRLRAEVDSLLAYYQGAPGFLQGEAGLVMGDGDGPNVSTLSMPSARDERGGPSDSAPSIGDFGHYLLLEELGRGGQASVYLARDRKLNRNVALKVLSLTSALAPDALRRFEREANAAARLDHPGICSVYETGDVHGVPYIAMSHVEGTSLADRLDEVREQVAVGKKSMTVVTIDSTARGSGKPRSERSTRRADLDDVLRFFEDAARALHVAHEAGLIHRDIKPGNLMIAGGGDPVILDFGLVRDLQGDEATLTRSGDLMGTPRYMSPEQITANRIPLDRTTDVYSLGATLFESVTLRPPFEAATREGLYQKILSTERPDAREWNPALPRDLAVVLSSTLEPDRQRRYQSALDLAEDIGRVRKREPIRARPAGRLLRLRRWAQRSPAMATGLVATFLLLVASLALAGGFIEQQRNQLRHTQATALSRESFRIGDVDQSLALLLAEAAVERAKTADTVSFLHRATGLAREKQVFEGHRHFIFHVEESPDGQHLVSCSSDGTARIWRVDGGDQVVLNASDAVSRQVACFTARFSAKGDKVVTASGDRTARVWTLDGQQILKLPHEEPLWCADFSDDGRELVITGGEEGLVTVWDTRDSSKPLVQKRVHAEKVKDIAASRDYFVSVSFDGTAALWRLSDLSHLVLDHEDLGSLIDVEFSPDGDRFLTVAGEDRFHSEPALHGVTIWSFRGERIEGLRQYKLTGARFDPRDPRSVFITTMEGRVCRWDSDTNKVETFWNDKRRRYLGICVSRDGERVLAHGFGPLLLFDRGGLLIAELAGHRMAVRTARFLANGDVASGSEDRTLRLWTTRWNDRYPSIPVGSSGTYVWATFSPDGESILCTGAGASLWDRQGNRLRTLQETSEECWFGAFGPEGNKVALCYERPRKILVQGIDGQVQRELTPFPETDPDGFISSASFSPTGDEILAAANRCCVWDERAVLRKGLPDEPGPGPHTGLISAFYSPDGRYIVTAGNYGCLLWNRNLERLHRYPHDESLVNAAFSPDGNLVVTCSGNRARLWNLRGETPLLELVHEATVWSATFSPEENLIVTGSEDRTARIWDLEGNCRAILLGHDGAVVSAEFSPDGRSVLTGSDDGTARVWPVHIRDLLQLAEIRSSRGFSEDELVTYEKLLVD